MLLLLGFCSSEFGLQAGILDLVWEFGVVTPGPLSSSRFRVLGLRAYGSQFKV